MTPKTHLAIHPRYNGEVVSLAEGQAVVQLTTIKDMAADDQGLVHGGFVFGMADYAAMLAVNDPHVVLAGATVRFLAPVAVGEQVVGTARVVESQGRKHIVEVTVKARETDVFSGRFTCVVLNHHVLQGRPQ